jgi:hypothetical protein
MAAAWHLQIAFRNLLHTIDINMTAGISYIFSHQIFVVADDPGYRVMIMTRRAGLDHDQESWT